MISPIIKYKIAFNLKTYYDKAKKDEQESIVREAKESINEYSSVNLFGDSKISNNRSEGNINKNLTIRRVTMSPYRLIFFGKSNETDLNDCENGGFRIEGRAPCICPDGFWGFTCANVKFTIERETYSTGCLLAPCLNGGVSRI